MTVTIVNNKNNSEVLEIYEKIRLQCQSMERSLHPQPQPKGWFDFGPYKSVLNAFKMPLKMNALESIIMSNSKSRDSQAKENADYFNYIYNNCVAYLKHNQNRYWSI